MTNNTEWKIDDYIKTPDDVLDFMKSVMESCKKGTAADKEFVLIACNDIVRIANAKGWLDDYTARVSKP